jgi:hypothetical protein
VIDVDQRYNKDKKFRSIVNRASLKSKVDTSDGIDAISQMEKGIKKILSSTDNRDFTLKYIGEFRISAYNMKKKTSYFISLYRNGRISDKSLIRDCYLDFKAKQKEKIERYRSKAERWSKKNGISVEDFRKKYK